MTGLREEFSIVSSLDSLLRAHKHALRGKRYNRNAVVFDADLVSNLLRLQSDLRAGAYQPQPYRRRVITEPKVRLIEAPAYRDRIVHHALHATLSPFYERHFIPDSYACRPKRGIHQAANRVQAILRRNGPNLYVCKLDVSKYYASINHAKLAELLQKHIGDEQLLGLLKVIIASTDSGNEHDHLFPAGSHYFTKGPRGIPIGNLTSQLFANIYLHHVDTYAKHKLKIRHYVRYMDDILLFHHDKTQLRTWQQMLTSFLYEEMCLTINPRKVRLYPARAGVDFVGYVIYPRHKQLRGSSVRRYKRKYRRQLRAVMLGRLPVEDMQASFTSWEAHARHTKSDRLRGHLRDWQEDYLFVLAIRQYVKQRGHPRLPTQLSLFDEM